MNPRIWESTNGRLADGTPELQALSGCVEPEMNIVTMGAPVRGPFAWRCQEPGWRACN